MIVYVAKIGCTNVDNYTYKPHVFYMRLFAHITENGCKLLFCYKSRAENLNSRKNTPLPLYNLPVQFSHSRIVRYFKNNYYVEN